MDLSLPKTLNPVKKTGYHHGDLRASIINAVAQLIGEKKGLNFQLKEVAELVGTSQPAIYKHFSGKNALLVETAIEGYQLQKQIRNYAIKRTNGSSLSMLLAVALAYVHFSRAHPGYFLLMKNLETEEILSSKRYESDRKETVELVLGLIRRCLDEGVFTDIEPRLAMIILQSTAQGLAHLYITDQINLIYPDHASDPFFSRQVFVKSLESFLSAKGKKELLAVEKEPFAQLDGL